MPFRKFHIENIENSQSTFFIKHDQIAVKLSRIIYSVCVQTNIS